MTTPDRSGKVAEARQKADTTAAVLGSVAVQRLHRRCVRMYATRERRAWLFVDARVTPTIAAKPARVNRRRRSRARRRGSDLVSAGLREHGLGQHLVGLMGFPRAKHVETELQAVARLRRPVTAPPRSRCERH